MPQGQPELSSTPQSPDTTDELIISDLIQKIQIPATTIVTVPIWGWLAHGKTCALLAATQKSTVNEPGICFVLVKDTSSLRALEESSVAYQGLGLANAADMTVQKMKELYSTVYEERKWPHGTETPSSYLFEVVAIAGSCGHVLFPDLRGGSYKDFDATAAAAIESAHACIAIINSNLYVANSPEAHEYRNDILKLLHKCKAAHAPALLLLTKADEYHETTSPLDESRKQLNTIASTIDKTLFRIAAASVYGETTTHPDTSIPPDKELQPTALVRNWAWITLKALTRSSEEVAGRVPRTNLPVQVQPKAALAVPMRELRTVRQLSDSPGRLVLGLSDGAASRFLFLDDAGAAIHSVRIDAQLAYKFDTPRILNDWTPTTARILALECYGTLFVGQSREATVLWRGEQGQPLRPSPVPHAMRAWCPLSNDTIVAVDGQGNLHCLRLESDKWVDKDYVANFIPTTPNIAVGELIAGKTVLVTNGQVADAISLSTERRFESRLDIKTTITYDTPRVIINQRGVVAAMNAAHELLVAQEKPAPAISGLLNSDHSFALAASTPIVAWIDQGSQVHGATLIGDKLASTQKRLAPKVDGQATGVAWNAMGTVLAVSCNDGRWGYYRALGF